MAKKTTEQPVRTEACDLHKGKELLKKYHELGSSFSAMQQHDTVEISHAIDLLMRDIERFNVRMRRALEFPHRKEVMITMAGKSTKKKPAGKKKPCAPGKGMPGM